MSKVLTPEELKRVVLSAKAQEVMSIYFFLMGYEGTPEEAGAECSEGPNGTLTLFFRNLVHEYGDEEDCTYTLEPDEWRRLAPGEPEPEARKR